jgi:hypothetical protein
LPPDRESRLPAHRNFSSALGLLKFTYTIFRHGFPLYVGETTADKLIDFKCSK